MKHLFLTAILATGFLFAMGADASAQNSMRSNLSRPVQKGIQVRAAPTTTTYAPNLLYNNTTTSVYPYSNFGTGVYPYNNYGTGVYPYNSNYGTIPYINPYSNSFYPGVYPNQGVYPSYYPGVYPYGAVPNYYRGF